MSKIKRIIFTWGKFKRKDWASCFYAAFHSQAYYICLHYVCSAQQNGSISFGCVWISPLSHHYTLYMLHISFCCSVRSESSQIQIHMMNNCGTSRFLYWSYFWAYSVKINKNFQELGFVWNDFHFSVSRQFAADAQRICVAPVNRYWAVPICIYVYYACMLCMLLMLRLQYAWEFHNHGRIFSINKVTLISSAQ